MIILTYLIFDAAPTFFAISCLANEIVGLLRNNSKFKEISNMDLLLAAILVLSKLSFYSSPGDSRMAAKVLDFSKPSDILSVAVFILVIVIKVAYMRRKRDNE